MKISLSGDFHFLDNLCLLEGRKGAILLNSLQTLHRDVDDDGLAELRDVDTTLLEIGLSADLARRVELRRTDAIRVPPADLRAFTSDFTSSCHSQSMVA